MEAKKKNAVLAFLEEYKKAVTELQKAIEDVTPAELIVVVDKVTANPECRSIQTILTHIVSSAYSYCVYIQNHRNINSKRPVPKLQITAFGYVQDLDKILNYTEETFNNIYDHELEIYSNSEKIATQWGQFYDIEQMMEHAIVHVLRHRRQIVNFKKMIRSKD